jgi:hypothetical protein
MERQTIEKIVAEFTITNKDAFATAHVLDINDQYDKFITPLIDSVMNLFLASLTEVDGYVPPKLKMTISQLDDNPIEEQLIEEEEGEEPIDGDKETCVICCHEIPKSYVFVFNCECKNSFYHLECGIKCCETARTWKCPTCRAEFGNQKEAFSRLVSGHPMSDCEENKKPTPFRCRVSNVAGIGNCAYGFASLKGIIHHVYRDHCADPFYNVSDDFRDVFYRELIEDGSIDPPTGMFCKTCEGFVCIDSDVDLHNTERILFEHLIEVHGASYLHYVDE